MPLRTMRSLTLLFAASALCFTAGTRAAAQGKPAKPAAAPAPKTAATAGLIDINRASAAELETIPGIGKAYAARIIGGRPYANKAQLVQKNILGQALYDRVKDRIIARQ